MTDRQGVCAKRVEDFIPGVPYVRGWTQAKRGANALAEMLRELGLGSDFPGLNGDVNINGDGIVRLGPVRPEAAKLLASALSTGMVRELGEREASADRSGVASLPERQVHAE
ncbi:hypothetical protein AB0O01_20505 [Streptomyces sp. NPDC093252]|uniref:hypothetical protein n=1 Tax=Streptomyces sp. NPDC093252 TaxID=3154980 RepID=UPI003437892A